MNDWNPDSYAKFRALRLRPALDLALQVPPALPDGPVVDLGCGDGASAALLRQRFPGRALIGVDASPAMIARARGYDALEEQDIAGWRPETPPALIFSNAALHWLPNHAALFPRLAAMLAPGGVLAVQMPRQQAAPSHSLLRDVAEQLFPDRFDFADWTPQVATPVAYHDLLSSLGTVSVWETEYLQALHPVAAGHPVRHFTASTAMRPITARLDPDETQRFVAAYDAALADAYALTPDGSALFPFRRLFVLLIRPS